MRRSFPIAAAMLASAGLLMIPPLMAADAPHAAEGSQNLRAFTLKNAADRSIVEAHAYTTTGKDIDLTRNGPIRPQLAQNFMVQHAECLDRVALTFDDGKTLASDHMNNCVVSRILAENNGISVDSVAGGPVFPSEGSRNNAGGTKPPQL